MTAYPVAAWDAQRVVAGELSGKTLDLQIISGADQLEDIRNCSAAPAPRTLAVSAIDRSSHEHGLWSIDLDRGTCERTLTLPYLINNAIDPNGRYVCYVAPSSAAVDAMSLYVFDSQSSHCAAACRVLAFRRGATRFIYCTRARITSFSR